MSGVEDVNALADELTNAYATKTILPAPLSSREAGFDLAAAYAIEAELVRRRRAGGRKAVGRKVGFANRAMWRVLKLDTLVWAHMFDDTIHMAPQGHCELSIRHYRSPRIEPEVVVKMSDPNKEGVPSLSGSRWGSRSSTIPIPTGSSHPSISWLPGGCMRR